MSKKFVALEETSQEIKTKVEDTNAKISVTNENIGDFAGGGYRQLYNDSSINR